MSGELNEIVNFIITILVFPGLLFTLIASFLTQWYYRKLYAHMQNRVGPRFIGPFGLLQPIADFLKLLFKEDITTIVARKREQVLLLSLGAGACIALLAMLPFSPHPIAGDYDVIIALYLTLWPTIALVLVGMMAPNPFTIIGTSRYLSLMLTYEPLWAVTLIVPVVLVSRACPIHPIYSLYTTSLFSWALWRSPTGIIALALGLITSILVLQCKLMLKPFDIPEAETEIVAGMFTEYSGPKLAYIVLLHDLEIVVYSILITYLYLGGPAPFPLLSVEGILTFIVKYALIVLVLIMIKAATARFRIEQAMIVMLKYAIPMGIASILIASLAPITFW